MTPCDWLFLERAVLRALRRFELKKPERTVAEVLVELSLAVGRPGARLARLDGLCTVTGMGKGHVSAALASLREMGIVEVWRLADASWRVELQCDWRQWRQCRVRVKASEFDAALAALVSESLSDPAQLELLRAEEGLREALLSVGRESVADDARVTRLQEMSVARGCDATAADIEGRKRAVQFPTREPAAAALSVKLCYSLEHSSAEHLDAKHSEGGPGGNIRSAVPDLGTGGGDDDADTWVTRASVARESDGNDGAEEFIDPLSLTLGDLMKRCKRAFGAAVMDGDGRTAGRGGMWCNLAKACPEAVRAALEELKMTELEKPGHVKEPSRWAWDKAKRIAAARGWRYLWRDGGGRWEKAIVKG